jgi:hypothetical protein
MNGPARIDINKVIAAQKGKRGVMVGNCAETMREALRGAIAARVTGAGQRVLNGPESDSSERLFDAALARVIEETKGVVFTLAGPRGAANAFVAANPELRKLLGGRLKFEDNAPAPDAPVKSR